MNDWIKMSDRKPKKRELCDFLWTGTGDEPLIWMLCRATITDTDNYAGKLMYWRPAVSLPDDIREYEEE